MPSLNAMLKRASKAINMRKNKPIEKHAAQTMGCLGGAPLESADLPSKTKLSKENSQRLLRHMEEDPPNPLAKSSLERGRDVVAHINHGKTFKIRTANVPAVSPEAWEKLETLARNPNGREKYPELIESDEESRKK